MLRFVALACLAAVCAAQIEDQNAKILKEQRFNAGDGRAGSAFATENGVVFREETDVSGNRIGQYSYIGDDGKTYTVKYSAGKDGFRILDGSGSHIPSGGQDAAQFVADPDAGLREEDLEPEVRALPPPRRQQPRPQQAFREPEQPAFQPRPQQQQQPAFQPRQQQQPAFQPQPAKDPNFNPFINPHDPTHRNFQFNKNAIQFNPENPLAKQLSLVPDCAGCKGVNPFVNPFDETHSAAGILAGHQAGFGIPQQRAPAPRPAPARPAPRPAQARPAPRRVPPVQQSSSRRGPDPTHRPSRNFPLGTLNLDRGEFGFNFDFES